MSRNRLQTALDEGAFTFPAGKVTVMRPQAGYDLSGLERDAVEIVQTFRPDADAFAAAGYPVVAEAGASAAAVIVLPRSKALAKAMVADACRVAGLVVIDGQKVDGADALWRDIRARIGDVPCITKSHGRLFWFPATDAFADWAMPAPEKGDHGFFTQAGVFSDGAVDAGSALLAAALPAKMPKRIADLGAGWGYLSQAILAREGVTELDLVEAESLSLDCARLNVTDPRARFHWADATQFKTERPLDGIVMNPPFHIGRAADPSLGRAFIAAAKNLLGREGQLWMVANRHLPYEAALKENFRVVTEIGGNGGFKLFHAAKPIR